MSASSSSLWSGFLWGGGNQSLRPCRVLPTVADGGCAPPWEDPGSSNPVYPPSRSASSQQLRDLGRGSREGRARASVRGNAPLRLLCGSRCVPGEEPHGCGPAQGCCAPADLRAGYAPAGTRRAAVGACSSLMLQGNAEEPRQEPRQRHVTAWL